MCIQMRPSLFHQQSFQTNVFTPIENLPLLANLLNVAFLQKFKQKKTFCRNPSSAKHAMQNTARYPILKLKKCFQITKLQSLLNETQSNWKLAEATLKNQKTWMEKV